jgi:hypothetical protein
MTNKTLGLGKMVLKLVNEAIGIFGDIFPAILWFFNLLPFTCFFLLGFMFLDMTVDGFVLDGFLQTVCFGGTLADITFAYRRANKEALEAYRKVSDQIKRNDD